MDTGFEVSVSQEQLDRIRKRYEFLRKTEQYRGLRVRKTFQPNATFEELEQKALEKIKVEDRLRLEMNISFPIRDDGEARWREYGGTVQRLFAALAKRCLSPDLDLHLRQTGGMLGYDLRSEIEVGEGGKEEAIKAVLDVLRIFFQSDATKYADEPIHVSLTGSGNYTLDPESFRVSLYLDKSPCQDGIVLGDMPLVVSYYKQVADFLMRDIVHRGLTCYTAVDLGDGESIIRRNGVGGQRLVADDVEDVGRLIWDYHAYKFVPDVNVYGSECISRIPIDLDRPRTMSWSAYAEFVNGFLDWLKELGFNPRLRLTGGRGAQMILEISIDRLAQNYSTPWPKPLKWETWWRRFRMPGLMTLQAADLVKILGLAYGQHLKKSGKNAPLTIEMHDLTQKYWNILVDSSRCMKGMGITSLGSIHNKTLSVCMPVSSLPSSLSVESALSASHWPEVEIVDFEPRYKSPWIQAVGGNPLLLNEPSLSSRDNPFSLVEEAFEKYSWIPGEYVKMGSERFMEKYCWA